VRSLAQFLKQQKGTTVGLVIVDGTHLIDNVEIYSVKNSDKYPSSSSTTGGASVGKPKKGSNVMAMAAQTEIPNSDDFFGGSASIGTTV
jgi:hypothetical protein